jgi:hypothetical protein
MNVTRIIKNLDSIPEGHALEDLNEALKLATDREKIYLGILPRNRRPILEDRFQQIQNSAEGLPVSIEDLLQQFA